MSHTPEQEPRCAGTCFACIPDCPVHQHKLRKLKEKEDALKKAKRAPRKKPSSAGKE